MKVAIHSEWKRQAYGWAILHTVAWMERRFAAEAKLRPVLPYGARRPVKLTEKKEG